MATPHRVVALSGGVGGAKLALGLDRLLPSGDLAVIVNTGDDFEHLGLSICPDLDTLLYTLADLANPVAGWGRADESWSFMETLRELGGEVWFNLGDRDLALHIERTRRLKAGADLTEVMQGFAATLRINSALLPMSNDPVRTQIRTDIETLGFQDYFVRLRCAPVVRQIDFVGASAAHAAPLAIAALGSPKLEAVIICPSNPYLSIDPILSLPAIRHALQFRRAPVVVVSPIVGGDAVKGPTAKIMRELGFEVSSQAIARHYSDLIDGLVVDHADEQQLGGIDCAVHVTRTVMRNTDDKLRLAEECLRFAKSLTRDA